jgi:hypothetical protein
MINDRQLYRQMSCIIGACVLEAPQEVKAKARHFDRVLVWAVKELDRLIDQEAFDATVDELAHLFGKAMEATFAEYATLVDPHDRQEAERDIDTVGNRLLPLLAWRWRWHPRQSAPVELH